jgi:hypothetical protein
MAIQKEAVSRRHCGGYRPITRALKWVINHKRVLRLMREDNLLEHSSASIPGDDRQ